MAEQRASPARNDSSQKRRNINVFVKQYAQTNAGTETPKNNTRLSPMKASLEDFEAVLLSSTQQQNRSSSFKAQFSRNDIENDPRAANTGALAPKSLSVVTKTHSDTLPRKLTVTKVQSRD
jgi:hypothetical protein